jgi:hypothetical protein
MSPDTEYREIVAFGAARCEANLVGACAKAPSDALACLIERCTCFAAPAVRAGRVAEARAKERPHRLENFLPHGGRGGVIEINRSWLHPMKL